jgi:hypothetical protein
MANAAIVGNNATGAFFTFTNVPVGVYLVQANCYIQAGTVGMMSLYINSAISASSNIVNCWAGNSTSGLYFRYYPISGVIQNASVKNWYVVLGSQSANATANTSGGGATLTRIA